MTPPTVEAAAAAALYSLDTPISRLPIAGYRSGSAARPRPAAVLVGLTDQADPQVVLTLRSRSLVHHAGQVAFPGGGRENSDRSVVETALREAREEAGIDPYGVRPLGYLGRYDTITGYRMTAVVAVVDGNVVMTADGCEVERVFTVPLAHVTDPDRYRCDRVWYRGRDFEILTLEHAEHHIWGATAALLHDFATRLEPQMNANERK